jgi:signal transduction histidine kinase
MLVAPLRLGAAAVGVLAVVDGSPRPFGQDDVAIVKALADQAVLAIEHTRLVQRAQDAAVLEERARLARDLHDSVTQTVFSLGMLARAARTQYERRSESVGATLSRIGALAQEALTEMRALLLELRPAALAESGLAAALEQLVGSIRGRTPIPIRYVPGDEPVPRLPEAQETAIFRIAQEALGNAIKHARASELTLSLEAGNGRLTVSVHDDGIGFDPSAPAMSADAPGGMGMRTMRERAAAAGLRFSVASAPGSGTTITVEAPLPAASTTSSELPD